MDYACASAIIQNNDLTTHNLKKPQKKGQSF